MNKRSPGWYCLLVVLLLLPAACSGSAPTIPTPTAPPPTQTALPSKTPLPTETPLPSETPFPTETPEGNMGSIWVRPKDGMKMVYVPKGVFTMGSNLYEPDEQPVHEVTLDAFWMDQTEVSNSMYAIFAPSRAGRQPVQNVSWEEAAAYCAWAGSRLPTEAEWEKAARGTDERLYPWGDQDPANDLANFADLTSRLSWADINVNDGYDNVAPVGSFPAGASPYGVLDMAGNLGEWVNDWYAAYDAGPLENPTGPAEGDFRVLRGGSWFSTAAAIRASDRGWYIPEGGTNYIGFRCAKSTIAQ